MSLQERKRATIALSDGTVETGYAIGYHGTTGGELCFNTSMYGYQEIFTDPSYYGQLMMMTYPHIGNYGVSSRDDEAGKVMVSGVIVRAFSWDYSNTMADGDLNTYLRRNKVVGISGVDTRKLVRHIRQSGVMNAVISTEEDNPEKLVEMARNWVPMEGLELASKVTRNEAQTITSEHHHLRVAAFDYGIKQSIINNLTSRGCSLRIFPAKTSFEEVMEWNPDGFFFSNGPGDPNPMDYAVQTVNKAKKTGKPIFGICLGHQLLALSEGIEVAKMFVGHRGANHPVRNEKTKLVEITTQNHGFSVAPESINTELADISHINLNDGTVEGLSFKKFNGFSVQYHPEASPGPHDSSYLFDEFIARIEASKG
ncbi:MAG: glutamine-hydrolyzing carbamoyl-phosphate synthase small subunit [Balneolales bacterium]|nr:glutamine-hydrolyzing carbamoyl-phosphate synthase small subunit [Balneolales bacterium]